MVEQLHFTWQVRNRFCGCSRLTSTGQLGCCSAGSFMNQSELDPFVALLACATCPTGTYSTVPNARLTCTNCTAGYYNSEQVSIQKHSRSSFYLFLPESNDL